MLLIALNNLKKYDEKLKLLILYSEFGKGPKASVTALKETTDC